MWAKCVKRGTVMNASQHWSVPGAMRYPVPDVHFLVKVVIGFSVPVVLKNWVLRML